VADDIALLDMMLSDQRLQSQLYDTTNYYRVYDAESIPYLRNVGLTDYRSKAPTSIASFGAVDKKMAPLNDTTVRRLMYYHAERFGFGSSALPLSEVEISLRGNPEDTFEMNGRQLTPRCFTYYMRYGYVGRYLDWGTVNIIAELGPGGGTQTEIIAKLHPGITILLFDIPPQLYVCEAYLKAVFGERVVSYRQNRDIRQGFQPETGKIYIFGNWQLEVLKGLPLDLFWSAACLSATEPEVADNYLGIVNSSPVRMVYLMENFDGMFNAAAAGKIGVLEKTTMKSYLDGLAEFELIDKSPQAFGDSTFRDNYDNSFWRRKNAPKS
jgi:putative sugar O-methyltransferase